MKRLAPLLVLLPSLAWGVSPLTCSQTPRGTLQSAKLLDGATTNTLIGTKGKSIGFQMKINAGTADVSIQACCRDVLGSTGCDDDDEWVDLSGIGCVASLDAAGTISTLCGSDPPVCRYRGFQANTAGGGSVTYTYECGD